MAQRTGSRTTRSAIGASIGAVLGTVALVAASVLGLAAPALAHNYLISSTPKSGETLAKLPPRFIITTNEGLLDLSGHGAGFAFEIKDAAGKFYGDGCVTVDGPSMSIAPAIGAAGKYTVIWQIVSADGHVVSNQYPFTWSPSGSFTPAKATDTPQNCGGKSGGTAAAPSKGTTATPQNASLGLVLVIGGSILGLGVVLTVVLLLVGRRKSPTPS
jgi:methionine-rich copper-binding protein CopC